MFASAPPAGGVFMSMFYFFIFFIWIMLLFRVFGDIFRSHDMGGIAKAVWLIFVILVPYLGVFVYLIARGRSMGQRDAAAAQAQQDQFKSYVQQTAGTSGAEGTATELANLAELKNRGGLTDAEFEAEKAKGLPWRSWPTRPICALPVAGTAATAPVVQRQISLNGNDRRVLDAPAAHPASDETGRVARTAENGLKEAPWSPRHPTRTQRSGAARRRSLSISAEWSGRRVGVPSGSKHRGACTARSRRARTGATRWGWSRGGTPPGGESAVRSSTDECWCRRSRSSAAPRRSWPWILPGRRAPGCTCSSAGTLTCRTSVGSRLPTGG